MEHNIFWWVLLILVIWNIFVFVLYAVDKQKARKNHWRIKERTLLICTILLGGAGALLGMKAFRHKTKHWYFWLLTITGCLFLIAFIAFAAYWAWT